MSAVARRRRGGFDVWPGFVDALTSLIMVLIFVLLIFAIGQTVLSDTLAVKTRALDAASARTVELAKALSLSEDAAQQKEAKVQELSSQLALNGRERDQLKASVDSGISRETALRAELAALAELKRQLEADVGRLLAENAASAAQVTRLDQQSAAIRDQLGHLASLLDTTQKEAKVKDAKIADLGQQLNVALANQVSKLERYRSEFFGRLRETLGARSDVRVVGDRFVLPTDVLFESASAELGPAAQARLAQLVSTVREVAATIPANIDWVLRVDGHTDRAPIHNALYPSNWELSTARAVAIVKYLAAEGVPPERLSANGFGEFQPLDPAPTDAAYQRNRRIELQLTNR